jgi:hypothetical protein
LIWQALGPRPQGYTMAPEYFRWLGIECPPDRGEYLVVWEDYLKEHSKIGSNIKRETDRAFGVSHWLLEAKDEPQLAG